jgi:hypothetical protein
MVCDKHDDERILNIDSLDTSDPAASIMAAEGLELIRAFVRILSADDRRKVVELAERLARGSEN